VNPLALALSRIGSTAAGTAPAAEPVLAIEPGSLAQRFDSLTDERLLDLYHEWGGWVIAHDDCWWFTEDEGTAIDLVLCMVGDDRAAAERAVRHPSLANEPRSRDRINPVLDGPLARKLAKAPILGLPYARLNDDLRSCDCPVCGERIPLHDLKDFESYSMVEYREHYYVWHDQSAPPFYALDGVRLTDCCRAYSTFDEHGTLYCRACYQPVPCGQGDGNDHRPAPLSTARRIIFPADPTPTTTQENPPC